MLYWQQYPDDEDLEKVENWDYKNFPGLIDYMEEIWSPYGSITREGELVTFATGGWSGNESVIGAAEKNLMFRAMCWEKSERGGLDVYSLERCIHLTDEDKEINIAPQATENDFKPLKKQLDREDER